MICKQLSPPPAEDAPRHVHEALALARGVVPSGFLFSPLTTGGRSFSSFHGSPPEFVRDVHRGQVIVFFYKPSCGPCAVIRNKIFSSKGKLTAGVAPNGNGNGNGSAAAVGSSGEDASAAATPSPPAADTVTSSSPDSAASPEPTASPSDGTAPASSDLLSTSAAVDAGTTWLGESGDGSATAGGMSPEDQAMCQQLREHFVSDHSSSGSADRIRFLAVNTNENVRLTALHDVRSLPTFMAYHNGNILARVEGAHETEVLSLVKALRAQTAAASGSSAAHKDAAVDRLANLTAKEVL